METIPVAAIYAPSALAAMSPREQLRQWRLHHGLTQAEVGAMLGGLRQPHVSRYEDGKVNPGAANRAKIAELTGIEFPP